MSDRKSQWLPAAAVVAVDPAVAGPGGMGRALALSPAAVAVLAQRDAGAAAGGGGGGSARGAGARGRGINVARVIAVGKDGSQLVDFATPTQPRALFLSRKPSANAPGVLQPALVLPGGGVIAYVPHEKGYRLVPEADGMQYLAPKERLYDRRRDAAVVVDPDTRAAGYDHVSLKHRPLIVAQTRAGEQVVVDAVTGAANTDHPALAVALRPAPPVVPLYDPDVEGFFIPPMEAGGAGAMFAPREQPTGIAQVKEMAKNALSGRTPGGDVYRWEAGKGILVPMRGADGGGSGTDYFHPDGASDRMMPHCIVECDEFGRPMDRVYPPHHVGRNNL